ncbi:MAG: CopG family transcriptional regulator [Chloroflexi bacterium]|nr:CopG family transcriptional regulator [Chloroflexota bacterium]
MGAQNVTLALPADLLREAKHLAVDRGMSLSRFVAVILEEHVVATRRYRSARARQRRLLEGGRPLGTGGRITWRRDELHGR